MKVAEYKQISEEIATIQMPVDEFDSEGNVVGQHMETVEKKIPVYGMVYRDMTQEEEEQDRQMAEDGPTDVEPTLEARMDALESLVEQLRSFVNALGKTELVGKGTYNDPFTDDSNPINNAYYRRADGKLYVYMDGNWAEVDW